MALEGMNSQNTMILVRSLGHDFWLVKGTIVDTNQLFVAEENQWNWMLIRFGYCIFQWYDAQYEMITLVHGHVDSNLFPKTLWQ